MKEEEKQKENVVKIEGMYRGCYIIFLKDKKTTITLSLLFFYLIN